MNSTIAEQTLREVMSLIDGVSRNHPDMVVAKLLEFLLEDFTWLEQHVDPEDVDRIAEFVDYLIKEK